MVNATHNYLCNIRFESWQGSKSNNIIMTTQITIKLVDGRWLVNNKHLHECSDWEREFMNQFFQEYKSGKT